MRKKPVVFLWEKRFKFTEEIKMRKKKDLDTA